MELTKVVFGFALLGLRHELMLDTAGKDMVWRMDQLSPASLAQLAWCFAILAAPRQHLLAALSMEAMARMHEFEAQDICILAWALATLHFRHVHLLGSMAREVVPRLSELDDVDMARITWAFAALNFSSPDLIQMLEDGVARRAAAAVERAPGCDAGEPGLEGPDNPYASATVPPQDHLPCWCTSNTPGIVPWAWVSSPDEASAMWSIYNTGGEDGSAGQGMCGEAPGEFRALGGERAVGSVSCGLPLQAPSPSLPLTRNESAALPIQNISGTSLASPDGGRDLVGGGGIHDLSYAGSLALGLWTCPECEYVNKPTASLCAVCEEERPGQQSPPQQQQQQHQDRPPACTEEPLHDNYEGSAILWADDDAPSLASSLATKRPSKRLPRAVLRSRKKKIGLQAPEHESSEQDQSEWRVESRDEPLGSIYAADAAGGDSNLGAVHTNTMQKGSSAASSSNSDDSRPTGEAGCFGSAIPVCGIGATDAAEVVRNESDESRISEDSSDEEDQYVDGEGGEEEVGHEENTGALDALLETLRGQLRATQGNSAHSFSGQQLPAHSLPETANGGESPEAQLHRERTLELVEASRQAEKMKQGRKRSQSALKRRAHKKIGMDYIAAQLNDSYNATVNPGVRYYNSMAIRVAKGEKEVDVKVIEAVAAHAREGRVVEAAPKATKEQRAMARRIA